jgi:hypothetical protein
LLIVAHQPSENTRLLAQAVLRGAAHPEIGALSSRLVTPFEAGPEEVLAADAIILGTTENFGYMSGALKDFFERIYYPCLEKTEALPWALFIRAGNDGRGTRSSVERIVAGLGWKAIQPPLICRGEWDSAFETRCEELGTTVAAGLEAGIF